LRLPLITVETLARDRIAAGLAPDGIRGLVLLATGGDLLASVDVDEYVRRALDGPSAWSKIAAMGRKGPHVSLRIRSLYQEGYFHLDRGAAVQEQVSPAPH
jgi:hypothetical protein